MSEQLVWLRNDLRLDDNPALSMAQQQGPVTVVFVSTPAQWSDYGEAPAKLAFRAAALQDIADRLAAKSIRFEIVECGRFEAVAQHLLAMCLRLEIKQLWFNNETPLDEQRRDRKVSELLVANGVKVQQCGFDLLVSQPLLNKQGLPFKVFTPYYKRWLQELNHHNQAPYPEPKAQSEACPPKALQLSWAGDFRADLWPAQEQAALQRLKRFCQQKLADYHTLRDYPAEPATSLLSPYLASGLLGPRRCLDTIRLCCAQQGREWQSDSWLRELAWRDFYRQLMHHFPHLCQGKPFKPSTDALRWTDNSAAYNAWCEGKTGFPIIDAAMRQLLQTHWMHNRLRMLTASFFCKLLFMDWRQGEQFFLRQLIDGDYAANNGGWQWSASTGCDSAPYFRVFNPTRQSQQYDPEGVFIRRFVPELASVSSPEIHDPSQALRQQLAYPEAIIDYRSARQHAIDAFKNLSNGG